MIQKGKFRLALKCYREYLEQYPKDMDAYVRYGKLLRLLKNNPMAQEWLEKALIEGEKPEDICLALIELIYSYLDEYQFERAYHYFTIFESLSFSNDFFKSAMNTSLIRILLKKKLEKYTPICRCEYNFFERQMIEYQEEETMWHTLTYNLYGNSAFQNDNCLFQEHIHMETLYEEIKRILPFAVKTPNYNVFDTYLFYYPNIGISKGEVLNYLKVCVIPDEWEYQIVEFMPYKVYQYKTYVNDFKKLQRETDLTYQRKKNPLVK